MSVNEIVLKSPNDLLLAMNSMLMQMNRKQRKGFLDWVKRKRTEYDFTYPEGYKPPQETNNEQANDGVRILDANGSELPVVSSAIPTADSSASEATDSKNSSTVNSPSDVI